MNVLLVLFVFLITSDFGVPGVKYYPHSRVNTKVIHQEPCSATLIEFRPCLAEQGIDSKIEIEFLNLQLHVGLDEGNFCSVDLRREELSLT